MAAEGSGHLDWISSSCCWWRGKKSTQKPRLTRTDTQTDTNTWETNMHVDDEGAPPGALLMISLETGAMTTPFAAWSWPSPPSPAPAGSAAPWGGEGGDSKADVSQRWSVSRGSGQEPQAGATAPGNRGRQALGRRLRPLNGRTCRPAQGGARQGGGRGLHPGPGAGGRGRRERRGADVFCSAAVPRQD